MKSYTITKMSPACQAIIDYIIPTGDFAHEPIAVKEYFGGIEFIDKGGEPFDRLTFRFVKACHLSLLAEVVAAATGQSYWLSITPADFDPDDPEVGGPGSLFHCTAKRILRKSDFQSLAA